MQKHAILVVALILTSFTAYAGNTFNPETTPPPPETALTPQDIAPAYSRPLPPKEKAVRRPVDISENQMKQPERNVLEEQARKEELLALNSTDSHAAPQAEVVDLPGDVGKGREIEVDKLSPETAKKEIGGMGSKG